MGHLLNEDDMVYLKSFKDSKIFHKIPRGAMCKTNKENFTLSRSLRLPKGTSVIEYGETILPINNADNSLYISMYNDDEVYPFIESILLYVQTHTIDWVLFQDIIDNDLVVNVKVTIEDIIDYHYQGDSVIVEQHLYQILDELSNKLVNNLDVDILYIPTLHNGVLDAVPYMNAYELYYKKIKVREC